MNMKNLLPLLLALVLLLTATPALAQPTWAIDHPVNDYTNTLTDAEKDVIAQRVIEIRNVSGVQVALLVVRTTEGYPMDDYARASARRWGGDVLVTFALVDHHSDIETTDALRDRIPDYMAARYLDNARPALRAGHYSDAFLGVIGDLGHAVAPSLSAQPSRVPVVVRNPPDLNGSTGNDDTVLYGLLAILVVGLGLGYWLFRRENRGSRYSYGSSYGVGRRSSWSTANTYDSGYYDGVVTGSLFNNDRGGSSHYNGTPSYTPPDTTDYSPSSGSNSVDWGGSDAGGGGDFGGGGAGGDW